MLNKIGCMRCIIIGCMWHLCLYRKCLGFSSLRFWLTTKGQHLGVLVFCNSLDGRRPANLQTALVTCNASASE
jgi:hypothetical protein